MATLTVHWQHQPFSHDAGVRSRSDIAGTDADSVHTGILTDEHQEVGDGLPLLVEDATRRVYRPVDLPPGTQVVATATTEPSQPLLDRAKQAGFDVVAAAR